MAFSMKRTSIYMYYYIMYFFYRIAFLMGLYVPKKIETFLDLDQKYIMPLKTRFLSIFTPLKIYNGTPQAKQGVPLEIQWQQLPINELNGTPPLAACPISNLHRCNEDEPNLNASANIDPIFYDKKEFTTCVMEADNHLEKIWRTRIIFENTPRGNVIMFYDAYKLGFSFFCDQNVVSYDILNAIAMKYVRIFNCCDFFIDDSITPISSPFIKLHFLEDEKKNKPILNNSNNDNKNGNSAFVKLRNYSKENSDKTQTSIKNSLAIKDSFFSQLFPSVKGVEADPLITTDKKVPEKMKNKFVYLGKIHNFKMTQPIPKKRKVLVNFTSSLMENIRIDSNVQRQRMSYSDFKKSMIKEEVPIIVDEVIPIIVDEETISEQQEQQQQQQEQYQSS